MQLASIDQQHLSGVLGVPSDRPITDGGYLQFRLNGGQMEQVRGDHGTTTLSQDGHHTLTYRAFDAAGNASAEKEAVVRIDGTAPVGVFRALDPGDPRRLEVEVADATSGVAGGRIEYRKVGGAFKPLETRFGAGLLSARLEDEGLAVGRYELRAVVEDVAGNKAVIDKWADGAAATLGMPLRLGAQVEVGVTVKQKRCGKAAARKRAKARKRTRSRAKRCRRAPKVVKSLKLRHGKRIASSGRLTTSQGVAIPNAPLLVEGQARSGGPFARLGTAMTDAHGRFRFTVAAGPSRTVRYRYDGTNTVRPASAALTTKVAAAARLKVDRRRLRNGQAVRFTGKLLGKPIPAGGKVVALQAKVGREWRTFANPRANRKGVFRHRYRFSATTGLRRYAFRVVVAREAAYPYEAGRSPIVRVTVRGEGR